MYKIPSVRYTVVLLAIFLVPFIMKSELREPYPALILPSGAYRASIKDGSVKSTKYVGYGVTQAGVREEIDLNQLIRPAPAHYLRGIFDNGFGLREGRIETRIRKKRGKYKAVASTPKNVAECKKWVSHKLGDKYVSLVLIKKEVFTRKSDGVTIAEEIKNEGIYELN
jgi:hypothetical protein